jgi:hypothetical protein
MRDIGIWADPPEYYSNGSFVTVDVTLPEVWRCWHAGDGLSAAWGLVEAVADQRCCRS